MIGYQIREVLFGNWRNKGVALFFAVIIWFLAYKSETQSETIAVKVVPAARSESQVIIRQERLDTAGKPVPFDGTVLLTISGPRRQIDKFRGEASPREVRLPVEAGVDSPVEKKSILLTGAAFPFIPPGVEVTTIVPESLIITFDGAEDGEFPVEPVYQKLPEGMEVETPKIEPAKVTLRGPRSLLKGIRVIAEAWLGAADRFEDTLPLTIRFPEAFDRSLVERTVRFAGPSQVRFSVRLRYKSEAFDAEGARVRFLVPAARFPFRIQFDEESIKVRFQGPVGEIRRLRERVKDPDFSLAVAVPPPGAEGEQTIPFTEDNLLLYCFSERVQILQHPLRQAQGKGAWSYTLFPTAPAAKGN